PPQRLLRPSSNRSLPHRPEYPRCLTNPVSNYQQAIHNTKKQFASSPDLSKELMNAIMDGSAAQTKMCRQALDSKKILLGLLDILLGPAELYEALRARGGIHAPSVMAVHI
ncbi:hypothetical protein, partial [Skermanella aerolata]|uniref:hypothetical protein n=1 Tax=Skermanella aerolata TaxID=393310 RepID=UPI003D21ABCF